MRRSALPAPLTGATNEWLKSQGIAAGRDSFHLQGRAADVRMSGVPPARLAEFGPLLGLGGVGLYSAFFHLDTDQSECGEASHAHGTGSIVSRPRAWRMPDAATLYG